MPLKMSPRLQRHVVFEMGAVWAILRRELESIAGDHHLRPAEIAPLLVLAAEGPHSLRLLAERTGAGRPITCRAVDALEQLGFAERRPSAFDGRSVAVVATEEGRRVAAGIERELEVTEARLFADLKPSAPARLRAILEGLLPRRYALFPKL